MDFLKYISIKNSTLYLNPPSTPIFVELTLVVVVFSSGKNNGILLKDVW